MKIRFLPLTLLAALLAAGCGKKDTTASSSTSTSSTPAATPPAASPASTSSTPASAAKTGQTAAPAAATAGAARVIEIHGNDQMQFVMGDKRSGPAGGITIEAKAGEELKIVLKNVGTLPKEAMGHNLVLLKPGSDPMAFSAAAMAAKDKDYIPDGLKDQIVAHTKLLGPKQTDEITFKVPAAGEYPFLCSFPAHMQVGMKGTLVAK